MAVDQLLMIHRLSQRVNLGKKEGPTTAIRHGTLQAPADERVVGRSLKTGETAPHHRFYRPTPLKLQLKSSHTMLEWFLS